MDGTHHRRSTRIDGNPTAQGAFGGSVLDAFIAPTARLAKRTGDGFGPLAPITAADPFEKAWTAGLDRDGNAVVLTVRKHAPFQRIRATFVAADGTRSATRTISTDPHSSAQPQLSVAPDGTAVAAWAWHDPAGWRAQVAVRRPGQPAFGKPQTVSPPAPLDGKYATRPILNVAAGDGGRAALTWQFGGSASLPEAPLHVLTAGGDGVFGADQALDERGRLRRGRPRRRLRRRRAARLARRALHRPRGRFQPARRAGRGRRAALGAHGALDRRQGDQLGHAGRRRVLRRRDRHGRLGQAGRRLRGRRDARGLHASPGRRASAPRRP